MYADSPHVVPLLLLHHALIALAYALTPLIGGIVLIGILLAVVQGAFQIEDAALAMGAKLAIVLIFSGSAGVLIYLTIAHMAHDWFQSIPTMITRDWSQGCC